MTAFDYHIFHADSKTLIYLETIEKYKSQYATENKMVVMPQLKTGYSTLF